MAEQLNQCPHCGDEGQIEMLSGPSARVVCVGCGACGSVEDTRVEAWKEWERRTPGPATKAMLEFAKSALDDGFPIRSIDAVLQAFIDEWADAVTPPALELSVSLTPWKCCVCGQPVQIGDDLRPYHLAGPGNHDAELSSEDRKTLADELRLTD